MIANGLILDVSAEIIQVFVLIVFQAFQYPIYCYFSIGSGRTVTARLISHTESEKIVECENTEVWPQAFTIRTI